MLRKRLVYPESILLPKQHPADGPGGEGATLTEMDGPVMDSIGARIRQLRGKILTQQQLADAAGVSIDLIRKLEQGIRHTASVVVLQRIAAALDVDLARLLSKPAALTSAKGEAGVLAIRRALTTVDDLLPDPTWADEPLGLGDAERAVDYAWGAYWNGRYELLGAILPTTLPQLRATLRAVPAAERSRAAEILARAYQVTGDTLVHLGQPADAWMAIRHGIDAADQGDDELLAAALRASVAWQLLVQGRYHESEQVAVTAAQAIEPAGDVPAQQVSAYGILTVTAATATARAQRAAATVDLLSEASQAAARLGNVERSEHQTTFGPAKIAMLTVDCAVVQEQYPQALAAASKLPRDADLTLASRARHLADIAYSQMQTGKDDAAVATLLTMESMAPDWVKYQTLPRQTTAELVERQRRISPRLRGLAQRLGVTGNPIG
jgi:transcriptional regulator with XRE-family HTH domain